MKPSILAKYRIARRVWFHHTARFPSSSLALRRACRPFDTPPGCSAPATLAKASRLWKPANPARIGWAALPADERALLPATQHEARSALIHPAEGPCHLRSRARRSAHAPLTKAFRPWTLTKGLALAIPRQALPAPDTPGQPLPGWMGRFSKLTRAYAVLMTWPPSSYPATLRAPVRFSGGICHG